MNAESSRSHLNHEANIGKLSSLVDLRLAGSKRQSKTEEATADRLKEAQSINKSLTALGDVISALSSGEKLISCSSCPTPSVEACVRDAAQRAVERANHTAATESYFADDDLGLDKSPREEKEVASIIAGRRKGHLLTLKQDWTTQLYGQEFPAAKAKAKERFATVEAMVEVLNGWVDVIAGTTTSTLILLCYRS
eukprot:g1627.t1